MDILKGINQVTSLFDSMNPLSTLVEVGGKALGLPDEVKAVAKLGLGLATGNVVMVANGAVGFGAAVSEKAAKTEYHPSQGGSFCGAGYAANTQPESERASLAELEKHLTTLRDQLPHFDSAGVWFGIQDGRMARDNLVNAANNREFPQAVRDAARYFLQHPEVFDRLDVAANYGDKDGLVGLADIESMLRQVKQAIGAASRPTAPSLAPPATQSSAPVSQSGSVSQESVRNKAGDQLDPTIRDYREVLGSLLANWEVFDSAVGRADGLLNQENLRAILDNPNASLQLKRVAHFLTDHPEYFNRLEMAARIGGNDGVVGKRDVEADLLRVNDELARHRLDRPSASTQTEREGIQGKAGAGAPNVKELLNDPTLSLEEKVELIMMSILEQLDGAVESTMKELAAEQERVAKGTGASGQAGKTAEQDAAKKAEQLQLRLQKLMERRKQMFDLLSNMNAKFNEMAKAAIQNLGRA